MTDRNIDEAKGRLKKAIGALTDDEDLEREGAFDSAAADVKKKAEELIDSVRGRLGGSDSEDAKSE